MNCLAKFSLIVAIVLFLALPVHAAVVNLTEGSGNARIDFNGTSRNFTGELNIGSINVTEGTEVDGQQFKALDITSGSDKLHVGLIANEGEATLPTLTCYFAVPRDGQLEVSIKSVKTAMLKDIKVVPTPSYRNVDGKEVIESAYSQHYYAENQWMPQERYSISDGGIMRNYRIQAVTFYPVTYNPSLNQVEVTTNISFDVNITGGDFLIPEKSGDRVVSEAFLPLYKAYLANPNLLDDVQPERGVYWIIVHDYLYEEFMSSGFVEWKERKGYEVHVTNLSDIGTNPSYATIKNYIQTAYNTWPNRPEYILLVGDFNMGSGRTFPAIHVNMQDGEGVSDNYYTFVDGNDYFPDMLIGRFPVNNSSQLDVVIYKTFSYEKDCYLGNTDWYTKAVVSAGIDPDGWTNFVSSRLTVLLSRDLMMAHGFTQVDTQWGTYYQDDPTVVRNAINNGVGYVNYRGWGDNLGWTTPRMDVYEVHNLRNGRMLPFMTATVCAVGNFEYDECLGEVWLTDGTVSSPKGGAAFTGNANWNGHTKWTNAINAGLYWGLFEQGLNTPASCLLAGKMNLYEGFPTDRARNGQIELYFNTYNIIGDPALNLFTATPKIFDTTVPDTIATGTNFVHLNVSENESPIEGALVCAFKDGEIFEREYSDAAGNVDFALNNITAGTLELTITNNNFVPKLFDVQVVDQAKMVGYLSSVTDDDNNGSSHGNGDGVINPGETVELNITLKNFGTSETATGVTLQAVPLSDEYTVTSNPVNFGDIAPGETAAGSAPVVVAVAQDCPHDAPFILRLDVSDQTASWKSSLKSNVESYYITVNSLIIDDASGNGNGILDPGESAYIHLNLTNNGTVDANALTATLQSLSDKMVILDGQIDIGNIAAGGSMSQTDDAFSVFATNEIFPGALMNLPLSYSAANNIDQNSSLGVTVGTISSTDPIGPDNYGYYCYDNTDTAYPEHPEYNWIDIDNSWDYFNINDDSTIGIQLPFTFRYYGQDFDSISICDNGYIAFGSTWWPNFFNTPIPGPQNAYAQLSGLWNDFVNYYGYTKVNYHYDSDANIFIIGWNNQPFRDYNYNQTFEIILYNPAAYHTDTGDGVIEYQYNTVRSINSSSIGITSPDKSDGIQYYFESSLTPGAATVIAGRAIKFTTNGGFTGVNDNSALPTRTELMANYPNPFNSSTNISFNLQKSGNVELAIYNLMGQKVTTLASGNLQAGNHSFNWDASKQTSGVYFLKLTAGDYSSVKKAVLVK